MSISDRINLESEPGFGAYGALPPPPTDILFERSEQGDSRATESLVERFMPMAMKLANKYAGDKELLEDLVQVASLGLFKAVSRYDRTQRTAFSTFAYPTMEGELKRHLRDQGWGTHVPRGLRERALEVDKAMRKLQSTGDCTIAQVAEALDITYEEAVEAWLAARDGHYVGSIEEPIDGDGESDGTKLRDTLRSDEELLDEVAHKIEIERILAQTSPRDREIFVRHIMLEQSQSEVAAAVGTNQTQVSRLISRIKNGDYSSLPTAENAKDDEQLKSD